MKITRISLKPLFLPFREPAHWSGRVDYGASLILVKVETDAGIVGHGETTASFPAAGCLKLLGNIMPALIGQTPFDVDRLIYHSRFLGLINDAVRMPNLLLAGLEMALWDVVGQAANLPLYQLWGGASRDQVDYFGFLQGDTAEELAASARNFRQSGYEVIYLKIGRGEQADLENTQAVREAIGPGVRLRVDANGAWDVFTARNMIKKLSAFDLEFIEQPTDCRSLSALKEVRDHSEVPIAVDQGVYSLEEVYEVCRLRAADVLVLSAHETGGASNFKKAAAIGEAARLPVCLHGQFVSGLTDLFLHHLGLTVPNLTEGNQIMHQMLKEDILESPDLEPVKGRLGLFGSPGLGFKFNEDALARAAEHYGRLTGQGDAELIYDRA